MAPISSQMFKCVCVAPLCDFALAFGTIDETRAVLLEHYRVTHVDDNITPITSLEQGL